MTAAGQFNSSHRTKVDRIRTLARMLDAAVVIPGTNFRVGLDALLGLAPGLGDAVAAGFGGYMIYQAIRLGVPRATVLRMAANLGLDFLVGSVPVLGDLFDVAWKANLRNADLLTAHLDSLAPARTPSPHRRPARKRWLLPSP